MSNISPVQDTVKSLLTSEPMSAGLPHEKFNLTKTHIFQSESVINTKLIKSMPISTNQSRAVSVAFLAP